MIALPPAIYDHPYAGPVIETIMSLAEIREFCDATDALACVPFPPNFNGDKCFVYLPSIGAGGVTQREQDLLRRHETGHCNGWPVDHPSR